MINLHKAITNIARRYEYDSNLPTPFVLDDRALLSPQTNIYIYIYIYIRSVRINKQVALKKTHPTVMCYDGSSRVATECIVRPQRQREE